MSTFLQAIKTPDQLGGYRGSVAAHKHDMHNEEIMTNIVSLRNTGGVTRMDDELYEALIGADLVERNNHLQLVVAEQVLVTRKGLVLLGEKLAGRVA